MYATNHSTGFNPNKKLNINASTPNNSQIATCKLFVGNLATHTTGAHLQTIFHSYGQVIECVKVRERYGFVRFASGEEAQRALLACNGIQLNGYPMIVEYAQNEILISPMSPRTTSTNTSTATTTTAPATINHSTAQFRPHPYHAGRSNLNYQTDNKLTTPITINTNPRQATHYHHHHHHHHQHQHQHHQQAQREDIPLLSAASADSTKYALSTLNPDASAFTLSFSPSNHYQQSRLNQQKTVNHDNACSSSDYYSQSGLPSSGSASVRSTASLSPSILSAISPSMILPMDSPSDEPVINRRISLPNQQEKRQSISSTINLFIGDKILSLYGAAGSQVETNNNNNNQTGMINLNGPTSNQFDCRDIDPRDPIFIWNFAFYPDVSISPFVKRNDIKTLLERRVSLYSR